MQATVIVIVSNDLGYNLRAKIAQTARIKGTRRAHQRL
jgi:hypothetical protein